MMNLLRGFPRGCRKDLFLLLTAAVLSVGAADLSSAAVSPQIKASGTHTLALKSDGTLLAWGGNSSGELGDGTTDERRIPVAVSGLSNVIAIAAGENRSMAVTDSGSLWTWGDGTLLPTEITGFGDISAVAAGFGHYVALKRDGTVWAWGRNDYGQVGDGTTENRPLPLQVTGIAGVIAVAAGGNQTMALCSDGTVWAWGDNMNSQLGSGNTLPSSIPVRVTGLTSVVAIGMGINHGLALKGDGTVWSWGMNSSGQLGEPDYQYNQSTPIQVTALSGIVALAVGGYHNLALKSDGSLWGWGGNLSGQLGDGTILSRTAPVQISGLSGISTFGAGIFHSVALLGDGTVLTWGGNSHGQLGDGTADSYPASITVAGISGVRAVTAGERHSLAVKTDGTVWFWGDNSKGQAGDNTVLMHPNPVQVSGLSGITAVAAAADRNLVLKNDDTVWAWGRDGMGIGTAVPTAVAGLTDVIAIALGAYPSLAVKRDGTVMAWGDNAFGEVGDNSTTRRPTPVAVSGLSGVSAVAAGSRHSLALKTNGTVWAWGRNNYGQLGDNSTTQRLTPVQVSGLTDVIAIAAGSTWSLALKGNGTVWAWGYNFWGDLGDGTTTERHIPVQVSGLSGISAISASLNSSRAVKGDGTIWVWGVGPNTAASYTTVTGATSVAAGLDQTTLVLDNSGGLMAWGDNSYGQLGDGVKSFVPKQPVTTSIGADVTVPFTTAFPGEGSYILPLTVALTVNELGTTFYTLDNSEPTTSSPAYSGPISLAATTTLRYFTRDIAGNVESARSSVYTVIPSHPLAITFQGTGSGAVAISPGSSCTGSCTRNLVAGDSYILTATPAADNVFTGWSGDCSGTDSCTLLMDGSKEVIANFETVCALSGGPQLISATGESPTMNAVGEIVWSGYDPVSGYNQIFSSTRGKLTSAPVNHDHPGINRYGDIVWARNDFGNTTIHGVIDGQEMQLTFGTRDSYPYLTDSGELIYTASDDQIYSSFRGRLTDSGVHFNFSANNDGALVWEESGQIYSLARGETVPVQVTSGPEYHAGPSINDSNEIVWQQQGVAGERIYSSSRGQLTFDCPGGSHFRPEINACGDVAFSAMGYGGGGIYRFGSGASCLTSGDNTRPQPLSILPADSAQNVPLNAAVTINFSEAIDPASVGSSTLVVQTGGQPVAGTYGTSGSAVTFTPAAQLEPTTAYMVNISTGIRDLAGNPGALPRFWSFTTMGPITIDTRVTGNGSLSCNGPYLYGSAISCSVVPASGYRLQRLDDNAADVTALVSGNLYAVAAFTENHFLEATFVADSYRLGIVTSGSGSGNVDISPAAPDFTYAVDTDVTLTAVPGPNSLFAGWTGCDSVNGLVCSLRMTADREVAATFSYDWPIRIEGPGTLYSSFNELLQYVQPGALIRLKSGAIAEHILWNREIAVTLSGGNDAAFNPTGGFTTINGSLTIAAGTITVEFLEIR